MIGICRLSQSSICCIYNCKQQRPARGRLQKRFFFAALHLKAAVRSTVCAVILLGAVHFNQAPLI
jgi:hypothetical protein